MVGMPLCLNACPLGKVNRPTIFFLSGFYCSRGEDLVDQKRKYFHET